MYRNTSTFSLKLFDGAMQHLKLQMPYLTNSKGIFNEVSNSRPFVSEFVLIFTLAR